MTQQNPETVQKCIETALEEASLTSSDIGYVCAHATGTVHGDAIESRAIEGAGLNMTPVSSLKGQLGHSLGGSASTSAALTIEMMRTSKLVPNLNLDNLCSDCAELNYIVKEPISLKTDYALVNSFAFGGVNSSLVLKSF